MYQKLAILYGLILIRKQGTSKQDTALHWFLALLFIMVG
ncbi:hypothetical protein XBJ2_140007 [Xenorhabdus bovienii str. Jollieti]|uniref:Uncharacterized protein n=1 Tax=Xenorhabdus bovienii (strain SS-2004) TaxID=406818 RepID=D3UW82_XENBS|nr:hypothetical protein XBJ1_0441 [Xenorhabdus bovienii SS-2004]CDH27664.1 hypothetical protein XBJ2_140007 [Xenorhabdus bovienii str. Jollieti]